MSVQCEPMYAGEDGWSEWIHPLPGYLMQCCDCGLIHDAEFQIAGRIGDGPLNPGEDDETGVVIFRMRRHIASVDRSPEGGDAEGGSIEDESAVGSAETHKTLTYQASQRKAGE